MRLYVSILAVAALSTAACGKKAEPAKPAPTKTEEPAKTEPKKEEPTAKEEPKKEEPPVAKEEPKKEEPAPVAAVDRTEGIQKAMQAWASGKVEECFANFTDDAVSYNVGDMQAPEIKGKQAIIDHEKAMYGQMSDVKVKASRIIEAGDVQIVEAVMTANMKTKGADGAEVVKAVSTPFAMVAAYNAEGKITAMWNFMDQAGMMMQAGMIPGLPADFVAAKLPETTEVIKGEANPALAATYNAFGAKMKPDTIDAAVAEMMADDFTMTDSHTGKVVGKAELPAMMKVWMGMFSDMTMAADKEFSAGEYYVRVATNTCTYKQGIEGAKADTKLTTHELSISRIVDGKFKSYAGYENGLEMMSQLGLMGGAAEKPAEAVAAAGDSLGVAECDLYLNKMKECLGSLPDAAKTTFEQGMKTAADGWKQAIAAGGDAAKTALAGACKTTLDAAKQAAGQLCPNVKWE